jgi:tetratricopeptide (TPR) repeat protein
MVASAIARTKVGVAGVWGGLVALLFGMALFLSSWAVSAADPEATKSYEAGMAAYHAGKYSEAKLAFDRAFQLSRLHSMGIWGARARIKLGEWVEADAHFEALLKSPMTQGDAAAEARAQEQAVREREELRHRIPRLRIRVDGLGDEPVEVSIDGVAVDREFVQAKKSKAFPRGKSLQVNPGDRKIVAVSGEQRRELSVSLSEGETRDVSLQFVNPSTIRQKKCRDACRETCKQDNSCYVDCKRRCFTEKR